MELSPPFSILLTILFFCLQDRLTSIIGPKYFVLFTLLISTYTYAIFIDIDLIYSECWT